MTGRWEPKSAQLRVELVTVIVLVPEPVNGKGGFIPSESPITITITIMITITNGPFHRH